MQIISQTSNKAVVFYKGQYFKVSDNGAQTLIFRCDKDGNITVWEEVGGGTGLTLSEVLGNFSRWCYV